MEALLNDTIEHIFEYTIYKKSQGRIRNFPEDQIPLCEDCINWVFEDDDTFYAKEFTFNTVCYVLKANPVAIRRAVYRMAEMSLQYTQDAFQSYKTQKKRKLVRNKDYPAPENYDYLKELFKG